MGCADKHNMLKSLHEIEFSTLEIHLSDYACNGKRMNSKQFWLAFAKRLIGINGSKTNRNGGLRKSTGFIGGSLSSNQTYSY